MFTHVNVNVQHVDMHMHACTHVHIHFIKQVYIKTVFILCVSDATIMISVSMVVLNSKDLPEKWYPKFWRVQNPPLE